MSEENKEVKHRAKCEKMEKIREELEEMEKRLEEIEKKIDWIIEYLGLGMYNYQAKITYNIATEEEERPVEYKEPTTTFPTKSVWLNKIYLTFSQQT